MARMPDWLSNMMASDPNLIEDSPQFRAKENEQQRQNIQSAAEEAMQQIAAQTRAAKAQTVMHQMDMLDRMTPKPTPLAGPDAFFGDVPPDQNTPMTPNVPSEADFNPTPPETGPQTAQTAPDPSAEVQRISDATGIPPQQVAAMALLGKDIHGIEQAQQPPPAPPMPPAQPMPRLLAPSPMSQAPAPVPQAAAMPPQAPAPPSMTPPIT